MSNIKLKANNELLSKVVKRSWDNNLYVRANDIEQGTDYSYHNIILPLVIKETIKQSFNSSCILDIGCGCGFLTNQIYQEGRKNIVGLDISPISVNYAKKKYPYIKFYCEDICRFDMAQNFDLCLAIMALNNMPDIDGFFATVSKLLKRNGKMIIVIPHPYFWPINHLNHQNYSYDREIPYVYHFSTKGCKNYKSTIIFFHRKLKTYYKYASKYGFRILYTQEICDNCNNSKPDILYMMLQLNKKVDY